MLWFGDPRLLASRLDMVKVREGTEKRKSGGEVERLTKSGVGKKKTDSFCFWWLNKNKKSGGDSPRNQGKS